VVDGVVGVVGGWFHAQTKECTGAKRVRVEDDAANVTLGALNVTADTCYDPVTRRWYEFDRATLVTVG